MKTLIALLVLSFSPLVIANNISDFEIEGISIGDSILEYLSEDQIKQGIKDTRKSYDYLSDEFGEVYLFEEYKNYDFLSFYVKPKDQKFLIYGLRGHLTTSLNECYKLKDEILNDILIYLKNYERTDETAYYPFDKSGKSFAKYTSYFSQSGDEVSIICTFFEESIKKKFNYEDGLALEILSSEVSNWLRDYYNDMLSLIQL